MTKIMIAKKVLPAILFIFLLVFQSFAQEVFSTEEFQKLENQIFVNSTAKEIEEAISKAEKTFENSEKKAIENRKYIAEALFNYALFRKKVFKVVEEKFDQGNTPKTDVISLASIRHGNARQLHNLLEKAIKLYENELKIENLQLADAKFELAQLLYNYSPPGKFSISWNYKLERLKNSQDLYLQSLSLKEKLLDKNDDSLLLTVYFLANSFSDSADFEKALPLYERYISGVETKYGKKSESLFPALLMSAAILEMCKREDLALEFSKRISEVISEKEVSGQMLLQLTPRAKSFDYKGINNKGGSIVFDTQTFVPKDKNNNLAIPKLITSNKGNVVANSNNSATIRSIIKSKFVNSIMVLVEIDENGKVVEAVAQTDDKKLAKEIRKNVLKWEFRPFNYKNDNRRMKGFVYYHK